MRVLSGRYAARGRRGPEGLLLELSMSLRVSSRFFSDAKRPSGRCIRSLAAQDIGLRQHLVASFKAQSVCRHVRGLARQNEVDSETRIRGDAKRRRNPVLLDKVNRWRKTMVNYRLALGQRTF